MKVRKHEFSMNNENFRSQSRPGPIMIIMGVKDKLDVYGENEKFKQCFLRKTF